jgi:hypothetical protein
MSASLRLDNNFARQVFGMPPSCHASMAVIDSHRPSALLVRQAGGNYLPRTKYQGDTVNVTFMGFPLVVELDYMGCIEGVMNAADGTDCMSIFQDWALVSIKHLAHAVQMDREAA